MPKFAANLNWLFTEHDFLDRFAAASKAGFKGVECLFPYEFDASEVANRLSENDLEAVLINAPPGDWQAGDRGLGCLAGRELEFRESVIQAIAYASAIKCPRIHIMAGICGSEGKEKFVENLKYASDACAEAGITGLIEPINDIDMPGYYLTQYEQALDILHVVGRLHLGLQLDLYHTARMGKDPEKAIKVCGNVISHFQIAGVPDRHEPDTGDVDYDKLFNRIDETDFDGWIGCEYRPKTNTVDGLGWLPSL